MNAAITLCDALSSFKPKRVINYGSAGRRRRVYRAYAVQFCNRIWMCVRLVSLGQTPFEDDVIVGLDGDG